MTALAGAIALLAAFTVPAARAAEFTAKATGNWANTNTWQSSVSGTYPSAGDTILVGTVPLNWTLTVPSGSPATFSGGTYSATVVNWVSLNDTLTLDSGTFSFLPTGQTQFSGTGGFRNQGTFLMGASNTAAQTYYWRGSTGGTLAFQNQGIFAFRNGSTFTIDGSNGGTGSIVNSGTFAALNTSATSAFTGQIVSGGTQGVYFHNTGLLVADGTAARLSLGAALEDTTGTVSARNGGILTLAATGATVGGHSSSPTTVFSTDGAAGSEVRLGGRIDRLQGSISGTGVYLGNDVTTLASGTSFIDFGNQDLRWSGSTQQADLDMSAGTVMEFRSPVTYSPAGIQYVGNSSQGATDRQLVNKSTLTLDSNQSLGLYGGRILNSGTILMRRGGILLGRANVTVENMAGSLIESVSGTTGANGFTTVGNATATTQLLNFGTIRANARDLDIGQNFTDSGGRLEARDGGVLSFSTNTVAGIVTSGSTVFSTNATGTISLGGKLSEIRGSIEAGSNVVIGGDSWPTATTGTAFIDLGNSEIRWVGGNQAADMNSPAGGVMEFRSPVRLAAAGFQILNNVVNATLVNKSTLTFDGAGELYVYGGRLVNSGTFLMSRGGIFIGKPDVTIENPAGSLIESVSGTTGVNNIRGSGSNSWFFNSGTIRANARDLTISSPLNDTGGTLRAQDGATLAIQAAAGYGVVTSGSTLFSSDATGRITLNAYIAAVDGTVDPGTNLVFNGNMYPDQALSYIDLPGSTLRWQGNGYANLSGGRVLEFRSPVLRELAGNGIISGTGTLRIAAGSELTFANNSSFLHRAGATVENAGLMVTDGASATNIFNNDQATTVALVNTGTIRMTAVGTQVIATTATSGTYSMSNAGTLEAIAAGAGNVTLRTGSSAAIRFSQFASGTLTGGTYRATAAGTSNATLDLNAVGGAGAITRIGSGATVVLSQSSSGVATLTQLGSIDQVAGGFYLYGTASRSFPGVTVSGTLGGNGTFSGTFATTAAGRIDLATGGVLASTGTLANDGVITLAGATLRPSAAITGSGSIAITGQGTIDTAAFAIESSNALTGAGILVKTGAGRLRLSGAGSYSGGGTVSAGALIFANRAAQPATGTTSVAAGATLGVGVSASDGAFFDAAYLDGLFAGSAARVSNSSGVSNVGIDTTAGDFTYGSSVSGPRGLVKYGPNVLTLGGANTFSGGTEVVGGSIRLTAATGLGSGTSTLSGGTLDLNGQSIANAVVVTGGTLSGGTINASQVTAAAGRIAGVLSGAGFTKTGTGTLVLAGNNTYSGTTAITGGTLRVERNTGSLPGGSGVTISSTTGLAGLAIDNVGATGALSQSVGPLSFQAGAGTVTLVRSAAQDLGLAASAVSVAAGATGNLVPGGGANSAANGFAITGQSAGFIDPGLYYDGANFAWYDAGGFVRGINYGTDAGTQTTGATTSNQASIAHQQFTGNATGQTSGTFTTLAFTGVPTAYTLSSGSVTVTGLLKSGTGTTTMSGGTGIRAPSNTDLDIRTDLASGTLAINHVINANGSNGLTKSGAGTLSLGGANTFTGLTRPLEGTLVVAGTGALQSSTLDVSASTAGIVTFGTSATLGGLTGGRDLGFGGFAITVGNNGGSTSYSGILSNGSLAKTGTGTLSLSGSSTLANATSINQGVVAIDWLANSGQASPVGTAALINLGSGSTTGTLRYTGSGHTTDRAINLSGTTGGGVIEAAGSGGLVLSGIGTATGAGTKTLTLTGTSTADNAIGVIAGTGVSVTKTGPGAWRLAGASTYSGTLTVSEGTLVVGSNVANSGNSPFGYDKLPVIGNAAATSGTVAVLLADGVSVYRGFSVVSSTSQDVVLGGTGSGLSRFGVGVTAFLSRGVTLQAATSGTVEFDVNWRDSAGNSNPNIGFTVGSPGNDGTVVLASLPTSITGVNVAAGTARLSGGTDSIWYTTPVSLGSASAAGTLDLNGLSQSLASLSFAGNGSRVSSSVGGGALRLFNNGTSTASVAASGTGHVISAAMALDDNASFNVASGGRLRVSGAIATGSAGAKSLTKTGDGVLELSAANTYSGPTSIAAGRLAVNGSLASAVTVQAGATLGGSGRLAGTLTGDGLIAPGNSPGILTVDGQITPTGTTSFAFEFSGTAPTWSTGTASVNDVLRLTNADPFTSSLTSGNVVNVYFDVTSLANGDAFLGGFFSDRTSGQLDFMAEIGLPTYQFFVLGNGSGTATSYNGKSYYTLAEYNPGLTGATVSVTTVQTANFASGDVTNGQVTQFVIIPEPSSLALAGLGIGLAAWAARRRQQRPAD